MIIIIMKNYYSLSLSVRCTNYILTPKVGSHEYIVFLVPSTV